MKKNRTLIISLLLIAALTLGIGYAVLSAVNLNISGSIQVTPSQSNFGVKFKEVKDQDKATASVLGDTLKASMDVSLLTKIGDTASATFVILNDDTVSKYAAVIAANPTIATYDTEYFEITTNHTSDVTLQPGDVLEVTVTVKLLKTPAVDKTTPINITFTATPIEVTEETTTSTP